MKKMKIKVFKYIILHASSDILASLREFFFHTTKCYFMSMSGALMTCDVENFEYFCKVLGPRNSELCR